MGEEWLAKRVCLANGLEMAPSRRTWEAKKGERRWVVPFPVVQAELVWRLRAARTELAVAEG